MNIHEECGVFGVIAEKPINVANICYYGLYALQHRGQERVVSSSMTTACLSPTKTSVW